MTLALLITAATDAWAQTETLLAEITPANYADYSDIVTITQSGSVTTSVAGIYSGAWGTTYGDGNSGSLTVKVSDNVNFSRCYVRCNESGETTVTDREFTLNFKCDGSMIGVYYAGGWLGYYGVSSIQIYGTSGPEVTITGTSTEGQQAEFDMPQNDVTVTYTLKRDLSVETQVTVGDDHSAQPRYRVQKQGNNFQPYGMTTAEVMALFHVHDQIENEDLTATDDYTVQIYAVDENGQILSGAEDGIPFENFTYAPGQFIVKAQGQGNYVGQTTESNVFTLYQGYPVEIAAQSFATYYSDDEALTLEESFAETAGLYTVASVTATEAVLSEKIDVMPKRTPMLIYNESETAQQILLIPTADVAPLTDVADEFKGTAVEKEVTAAEVAATNFYVLTDQNQFVWVKDAGTIAAHRCWLEIAPSQAAGARRIVFSGSGTTGISTTDYTDYTDGTFYDLNGRKFIKKPTKKGIYIQNGKKVVVK